MEKNILYVGVDVDNQSYHYAGLDPLSGQVFEGKTSPVIHRLVSKLRDLEARGFRLHVCYEASYLGFSLFRALEKSQMKCDVIAPSLIPSRSCKDKKTDRLDSMKLAIHLSQGTLTCVHVPTEEDESVRSLIRSRQFVTQQMASLKKHIVSLCYRHGLHYKAERGDRAHHFTYKHCVWLKEKIKMLSIEVLRQNLMLLLKQLEDAQALLQIYDDRITEISNTQPYQQKVQALMCYRGIEVRRAMSLISEIGDVKRFDHPKRLVSWAGLDLFESSSGGRENKFGITRLGNKHVRTALVEACQSAKNLPKPHLALVRRRKNVPLAYVEVADRCMNRLYKKSTRLLRLQKHPNKVKVAAAREFIGFIWESLKMAS